MSKIQMIVGALVIAALLLVGVFKTGQHHQQTLDKVTVAKEAQRQAEALVEVEKKKWERKVVTQTKVEYVTKYIKAHPQDCAAQPYDPELVRHVLHDNGTQ